MSKSTRAIRSTLLAPFAALVLVLPGCGDDGLGRRYPVTGTVTYKGEKVKKATINFVPTTPEGRGASGTVEDGAYSLMTLNPGDGALPGKYRVTVDDRQVDEGQIQAQADAQAKKKGVTYNVIPQELQAKAAKKAKGSLPGKYQIPSTTDLEKEVAPQSNTIDVQLAD